MRPRLESDGARRSRSNDERAEAFAWSGGEVTIFSRRAPGKTGANEDAALILPVDDSTLLLAVADGCGGMPAADEAARRALEALTDAFADGAPGDRSGCVLAGFDAANQAVMAMRAGAGTTLAAVLVEGETARAFHAGDSLIIITGQRGRLHFSATAHSPTGFGLEAGLMSEREALAHEDRTVILNAIGSAGMYVEISQPMRLSPRDSVLLASDGLSDNMLESEIVDAVRAGDCAASVDALAEEIGRRMADDGHPDDLTIVAYRPTAGRVRSTGTPRGARANGAPSESASG